MAEPPGPDVPPETGMIEANLAEGEVFLRAGDRQWRLVASAEDEDRHRALPAGEYQVLGYRIPKTAEDGTEWFTSVASNGYRTVRVHAGTTTKLEIDERIRVRCQARRKQGGIAIQMSVRGEDEAGLSLYRAGARVDVTFELLDRQGRAFQSGGMTYG